MTDGCGKTLGSGPGGLLLPGDLDERLEDPGDGDVAVGGSATEAGSGGNDEERDWSDIDRHAERVAEVLGAVVLRASEGLERRQMMHEERVEARLEDIGGAVFRLASVQKNEAMGAQRREAAINGIRAWLESTWDRYMKGADRAEEAFQEVGRKLDWLMDDSREFRRRVSPAGRAGTGLSAALLGGLISCALLVGLAVAVGLVDVRWAPHDGGVTGANTTQMGIRAGRPGEGAARDDAARFAEGARDLRGASPEVHPDVREMRIDLETPHPPGPAGGGGQ